MAHFTLIHSPFLGPSVWGPLKLRLALQGHDVLDPDLRHGLASGLEPYKNLGELAANASNRDAILVLHSAAGALAPSILSAEPQLSKLIFVDALLPHPERSWLETLPPAMARRLLNAARSGDFRPGQSGWLQAFLRSSCPIRS